MARDKEKRSLASWSDFLRASSKLIWALVGLMAVAGIGRWVLFRPQAGQEMPKPQIVREAPIVPPVDWPAVNGEIALSLQNAAEAAHDYGRKELETWTGELQQRIDDDFLEWYFGYWQQQWLGVKAMGYWAVDNGLVETFFGEQPSMVERITEDVQEEFSRRVLQPQTAQLRIERVAETMVGIYVGELDRQLALIPDKYSVPPADWDRYLGDLALVTMSVEGDASVPITLKTLGLASVGAGTVAGYRIYEAIRPALAKVGSKISLKTAGRGAAEAAAKTGTKVAAKMGGNLLGPIIGVGVIIWDVWDHYETKKVGLPLLRNSLAAYLDEVEYCILDQPGTGLMSVINELNEQITQSMNTRG